MGKSGRKPIAFVSATEAEKRRQYHREWVARNPDYQMSRYYARHEEIKAARRAYYVANKPIIRAYQKARSHKNRDARLLKSRAYWKKKYSDPNAVAERRAKLRASVGSDYRSTINYRLAANIRRRVRRALKGGLSPASAVRALGCSIDELKLHIESQFLPGMTWNNWGSRGWHIDHIRPLASFDLTDETQHAVACHYTNLRPLWWRDNISKGGRWPC